MEPGYISRGCHLAKDDDRSRNSAVPTSTLNIIHGAGRSKDYPRCQTATPPSRVPISTATESQKLIPSPTGWSTSPQSNGPRSVQNFFEISLRSPSRSFLPLIQKTNEIHRFHRIPSDLRRYLEYMAKIKATHGSVLEFIIRERLRWDDLKPKGARPFEHPGA
ncbi:hypothetical protein PRK78_004454 [Emydomyces testavorans]|uniref:Uncharacterized protein n=1 Tax=Emydomyces testavorans TaxID=2070801 RepID=A0AAF0DK91_9EURO|nr:hypothetical protein PRK78_004454 [Emydomyces testavorans]